ncbi:Zn-dependent M28 family amino/carboxypeptidase [Lysobacter niabensis]|uniref:Zn-dependent M28 family amino/carboxypeptidase n=1 Tax=Agrilutibacter niabensis TaxID=380628 RepID=A0ABU1VSE7_9GAMM|nr:M28 family metallopeptidase [Lysobacter niabensis]MDR7100367.1 Zn-dependent M28 family amino/carboxypeptidase [Lysobacter niabensis]
MKRPLLPCLLGAVLVAACKPPAPATDTVTATADRAGQGASFNPAITSDDFARHVRTLASDEFEGRGPGSAGEEKSVAYIEAQFRRLGLKPGNGDSYFQTVPMVETSADENVVMRLDVAGKGRELKFGTDMVVGTRTARPQVQLNGSDLVFVGYGVNAPEQHWNDYAGVDVKGKTVVMLVNDPGFHQQDPSLFEGKRMTYYGRWTYKFEEAARQGAAAALIIHDTEGAAYGWEVVKNSWSGAQFDLRAADDPAPRLQVQGWLSGEAARSLLASLGQDLDALYAAAGKRGFRAIPLDAKVSLDLKSRISEKSSRNVIARLEGAKRPDEAVVYMAHWDHLGNHAHEADEHGGTTAAGTDDTIYNGAVDNATGVAGILEIAEAFVHQQPRPDRSLVFLSVTLEESGLLGSRYYVAHPVVPLAKTVAVINLDAMPVIGKARDMTVVGFGSSQLEDILWPIAREQGRTLHAEATPEDGFYFRSDHFNFARAGVPALYAKGGDDLVAGGTVAGRQAQIDYRDHRYHKPSDQYDPSWQLDGVMQDLEALYGVGRVLAGSDQWPTWYEGNAFLSAQQKLRAGDAR